MGEVARQELGKQAFLGVTVMSLTKARTLSA